MGERDGGALIKSMENTARSADQLGAVPWTAQDALLVPHLCSGAAAVCVALILSHTPVSAQVVLAPLPSDAVHDPNGVELAAGQFEYSSPDLNIGLPGYGALDYVRHYATGGGRDNFTFLSLYVRWKESNIYRRGWSVGNASYTHSVSGDPPPGAPNGASVVLAGNNLEYRAPDGTIYVRTQDYLDQVPKAERYRLLQIRKPNGEIIDLHWEPGAFRTPRPDGNGFMLRQAFRLRAVTNNYGNALYFNYMTNVSGVAADQWQLWTHVSYVRAINRAVDYCQIGVDQCSGLTLPWPHTSYSAITVANSSFTKTDAAGGQTFFNGALGDLRGLRLPNRTTGYDIQISTRSFDLDQTWQDGDDESVTHLVTVPSGTWTYDYDDTGDFRTISVTDPSGGRREYDSHAPTGRILSARDELGRATSFEYDGWGRITRQRLPSGQARSYTYDLRGNITSTTHEPAPGSGEAVRVEQAVYETTCSNPFTCNKPSAYIDARGNVTDYTYDAVGNLLTETGPAPAPGAPRPQTRHTWEQRYAWYRQDASGAISQAPSPIWVRVETSTCTTQATCVGTADEVRTTYTYQEGSPTSPSNLLPIAVTTRSGDGTLISTVTTSYDANGDPVTVDGPLPGPGDTTRYIYDALRRRVGIIGPNPNGAP